MSQYTKLKKVLNMLLDPRFVFKDDTYEQKLIDIFLKKFSSPNIQDSELSEVVMSCLHSYVSIETCANRGFFVQLLGCIGSTEAGFNELMQHGLVETTLKLTQKSDAWSEPSIRYAMFQALTVMANHGPACSWILDQGYGKMCFTHFLDKSLFVQNAAQRLLAQLVHCSYRTGTSNKSENGEFHASDVMNQSIQQQQHHHSHKLMRQLSDTQKAICSLINEQLHVENFPKTSQEEKDNKNVTTLLYLGFLKMLSDKNPETCLSLIKDCNILPWVCQCAHSRDRASSHEALDIVAGLIPAGLLDDAENSTFFLNEPKKMLSEGNLHAAIKLSESIVIFKKDDALPELLQIIQLPALYVSGMLSLDDLAEERPQVELLLKNKAALLRVLCSSFQALDRLLQQGIAVDCLQMLSTCLQEAVNYYTENSTDNKYLFGNDRFLISLLKTLKSYWYKADFQNIDRPEGISGEMAVAAHILKILQDTTSSNTVAMACLQCLSNFLEKIFLVNLCVVESWTDFSGCLDNLILRLMCDVRWEVRDSVLELIGHLPSHSVGDQCGVCLWMMKQDLHVLTWSSILDGESYVRASGLKAVLSVSTHSVLWKDLMAKNGHDKDFMVHKVTKILDTDTEAFPRRAAVQVLSAWYPDTEETVKENIVNSMSAAIKDFDWEVQFLVLTFWDGVMKKMLPDPTVSAYAEMFPVPSKKRKEELSTNSKELDIIIRCCEILHFAVNDCESKVCERAAQMITDLMPNLTSKYQNLVDEASTSTTKEHTLDKVNGLVKLIREFQTMDVPGILKEKSSTSGGYDENPFSVLDDIIASFEEHDEDAVIDCY